MHQILGIAKNTINRIYKTARHVLNPNSVWVNANASNVQGPRFDLNHEKKPCALPCSTLQEFQR
jgi:hypothetical protein